MADFVCCLVSDCVADRYLQCVLPAQLPLSDWALDSFVAASGQLPARTHVMAMLLADHLVVYYVASDHNRSPLAAQPEILFGSWRRAHAVQCDENYQSWCLSISAVVLAAEGDVGLWASVDTAEPAVAAAAAAAAGAAGAAAVAGAVDTVEGAVDTGYTAAVRRVHTLAHAPVAVQSRPLQQLAGGTLLQMTKFGREQARRWVAVGMLSCPSVMQWTKLHQQHASCQWL